MKSSASAVRAVADERFQRGRTTSEVVRERVKQHLRDAGLTQEQFANHSQLSESTVSRFMRGAEIQAEKFERILRGLGLSPADLLAKPPASARPLGETSIYAYGKPPSEADLLPLLERARQSGVLGQVAVLIEAFLAALERSSRATGEDPDKSA